MATFIWMIARLDEFFISVNGQSLRIRNRPLSHLLYSAPIKDCSQYSSAVGSARHYTNAGLEESHRACLR
jgi:hypothetical protein